MVIDKITNNPPAQRSQLTSLSEILRSVQKLTVKTDSIDSKSYLQYVINPLLVFKKFSDLIEDTGFRIRHITK